LFQPDPGPSAKPGAGRLQQDDGSGVI
jgi:hypothetical protein